MITDHSVSARPRTGAFSKHHIVNLLIYLANDQSRVYTERLCVDAPSEFDLMGLNLIEANS